VAGPGGAGERVGDERLVVAQVKGPHGVRGAVRLESLTDDARRFVVGSRLMREGDDRPLTVADAVSTPRGLIVRFEEISGREAADSLRDVYLEAPAPPRRRGQYLWHEVVGTRVEDRAGRHFLDGAVV